MKNIQPLNKELTNMLFLLFITAVYAYTNYEWSKALPFTRELKVTQPPMEGKDIVILQNLLNRDKDISIKATGFFDAATQSALQVFQRKHSLSVTGVLNPTTGQQVIEHHMSDGYKDQKVIPGGYMYKLYVPVHRNRSIETYATLYNARYEQLYRFRIRARGGTGKYGQVLNQLTRNGNTPTGLMTFDLNSPEPLELVKKFGPYNVLRCAHGLEGNAAIHREGETDQPFLSYYRVGILLHTGLWDGWKKTDPMPNSRGCLKTTPDDMKRITEILASIGVVAHKNPFGKLPYPFKAQGIISIEQID